MLPADHFLSDVVRKALQLAESNTHYELEGNHVKAQLSDPFKYHLVSQTNKPVPLERPQYDLRSLSRSSRVPSISNAVDSLSTTTKTRSSGIENDVAFYPETFGVVLAQIFLLLSTLSKSPDYVRLPAVSTLHEFPIIGAGKSFIARKIPRHSLHANCHARYANDSVFVYKSVRHYNQITSSQDQLDDGSSRLKSVVLEILVLTHEPLRRHNNIVGLVGFGWETNRIDEGSQVFRWPFLVFEHAQHGSMTDLFEEENVDFETRRKLCIDVGQGLSALHDCDITHGDIKLENVLVFSAPSGGYTAKLADFGFAVVNLYGKIGKTKLGGRTSPWDAPESESWIEWRDLHLTDVFSFGMLLWRTMCYGHFPFIECEGVLLQDLYDDIVQFKEEDFIFEAASTSLDQLRVGDELKKTVRQALSFCLRWTPSNRNLTSSLLVLGGHESSIHGEPLRHVRIPLEQGLGIYSYGSHDLRLALQLRHALESYGLSPLRDDWQISGELIGHGAATLAAEYLDRHFSGDNWDLYHQISSKILAMSWLAVSAGAGKLAAAEAMFPVHTAFGEFERMVYSDHVRALCANGLIMGSEFILKSVLSHEVPRRDEFVETFRTFLCRGSGIVLAIPKEAFDGSGTKHYMKYVGERMADIDFIPAQGYFQSKVTTNYLLGTASGWGCLEAVKSLILGHGADPNHQDGYGETALLKACRAGHVHVVEWLCKLGRAKANIHTRKGITPLHWLSSFIGADMNLVARLLKEAGADADAVAWENHEDHVEKQFFFFKGPPLIRAIASGDTGVVAALLAIGADPFVGVGRNAETALTFAARRVLLDILKLLIDQVGDTVIWSIPTGGGCSLLFHIITCNPNYGTKIHGAGFEKAQIDTFDFAWSKLSSPSRLFRSLRTNGKTALEIAVEEGNMPLAKTIVKSCPTQGHIKELLVTLGLQQAIIHGRQAMFIYFLSEGAQPLHPVLRIDPNTTDQYQDYVLYGPWTMDLAVHQRKTTSLHLCAEAGDSSTMFGQAMLKALLPPSHWDESPDTLRRQNRINCNCEVGPKDNPIVDCRNEYDETPFFLALRAEEYDLASQFYNAGANHNTLIRNSYYKRSGLRVPRGSDIDRDPIVWHVIQWASAYRGLHFLIHFCWGCLITTHPVVKELPLGPNGRPQYLAPSELRDSAIKETANLPFQEASIIIKYIAERAYPRHAWNSQLILAAKHLNEAAVAVILRRPSFIPAHESPEALYDAVRESLIEKFSSRPDNATDGPTATTWRKANHDICRRAWKIIALVHENYPDYALGGTVLPNFVRFTWRAIIPELSISRDRLAAGTIGEEKFGHEADKILRPWLAVMALSKASEQCIELQYLLDGEICSSVGVGFFVNPNGNGLRRDARGNVALRKVERVPIPRVDGLVGNRQVTEEDLMSLLLQTGLVIGDDQSN